MVKKLREIAAKDDDDATLMESVCQSAHQIWQAGLGAFATAQGQGEALFGKLVERGADVQKKIEHSTGHRLQAPAAGGADGSWEKLEKVFEDRVGRALHSLGVPTRDDLQALGRQIDALSDAIARLPAAPGKASTAAGKRAPAGARARTAARPADAAASPPAARKKARAAGRA